MRKIGIYPRISIEEPEFKKRDGSISSQVHRMTQKIEHKNLAEAGKWGKVVDIYKDDGFSAKDTNRPEFQRMMADVRRNRIDTIMVTELSRISRSVTDFLKICNELSESGCDFICLQIEGFDTTTPIGKFILTVMIALYQLEREMTAERISNNFYVRATKGLTNGGHPFLGYDNHPSESTYLINQEEARIVNKVYDLFLDGETKTFFGQQDNECINQILSSFDSNNEGGLKISEIAHHLNSLGYRNKKWVTKEEIEKGGNSFEHSSIHRILSNYSYAGIKEVNKKNKGKDQSKLKDNQKYSQEKASWPAIIDLNRFERAQAKLQLNKRNVKKSHHDYFLSGVLHCAECGNALFGGSAKGVHNWHYYYQHKRKGNCRIHRWPALKLEQLIKKSLFKFTTDELYRKDFVSAIHKINKSKEKQTNAVSLIDKKLKELNGQKANLVNVIASSGASDVQSFVDKVRELEKEIQTQGARKLEAESDTSRIESEKIDPNFITEQIKKFKSDGFRKKNGNDKKEIVQAVINAIYLHPDNIIRIDFNGKEVDSALNGKEDFSKVKGEILPFSYFGGPLSSADNGTGTDGVSDKNRNESCEIVPIFSKASIRKGGSPMDVCSDAIVVGGGDRDRTCDLLNANQMLSQLSYTPTLNLKSSSKSKEVTLLEIIKKVKTYS